MLQRLKRAKGLLRLLYWNKDVVMVRAGHNIAADAGLAKSVGEGCGEANRLKIGVHCQCDPRCAKQHGKAGIYCLFLWENKRKPFSFRNRSHWRQAGDTGLVRDDAVRVDAIMEHRLHGTKQDREISNWFAHDA